MNDDLLLDDPLESAIERDAIKYAKAHGWYVAKWVSPGKRGVPDRIFIRDGQVVFVEFKRTGEDLRPQQAKRIRELREHGAQVRVFDSLKDAYAFLR